MTVQQHEEMLRYAMERLSDDLKLDLLMHVFGNDCSGLLQRNGR